MATDETIPLVIKNNTHFVEIIDEVYSKALHNYSHRSVFEDCLKPGKGTLTAQDKRNISTLTNYFSTNYSSFSISEIYSIACSPYFRIKNSLSSEILKYFHDSKIFPDRIFKNWTTFDKSSAVKHENLFNYLKEFFYHTSDKQFSQMINQSFTSEDLFHFLKLNLKDSENSNFLNCLFSSLSKKIIEEKKFDVLEQSLISFPIEFFDTLNKNCSNLQEILSFASKDSNGSNILQNVIYAKHFFKQPMTDYESKIIDGNLPVYLKSWRETIGFQTLDTDFLIYHLRHQNYHMIFALKDFIDQLPLNQQEFCSSACFNYLQRINSYSNSPIQVFFNDEKNLHIQDSIHKILSKVDEKHFTNKHEEFKETDQLHPMISKFMLSIILERQTFKKDSQDFSFKKSKL